VIKVARPDVSIVIAVRDGARYLRGAIQSVLVDNEPTRELVIVDDGSVDATHEIIDAEARRDPRIVPLSQSRLGLVAALELGRRHARAPLIARLDADDVAYAGRFAQQAEAFAHRPDLALLGGAVDKIDENGQTTGQIAYPTSADELRRELQLRNPFVHSTVMFRADRVTEVGGYRSFFDAAEDYDLWFRLSERWDVGNLADCVGALRIHDDTVTRRKAMRQALSAVLVRRCATARQAGRPEPLVPAYPASSSSRPPIADSAELRLLRALEFADRATFLRRPPDRQQIAELMSPAPRANHDEQKLAQHALLNILKQGDLPQGVSRTSVAAALVRINPWRAIRLTTRMMSRS
jgi:GT2 family glycosyltransferase